MRRLKIPDGFGIVDASVPEFRPDQTTMERFDRDHAALWRACNQWTETVLHPPADWTDEFDCEFAQLTRALQLWASLHGIGDGAALNGKDVYQALALIDLIRDRSGLPSPAVNPSRTPKEPRQGNGGYTPNELAKVLRVGPGKIHGWIKRGELEAINVASAKCRKPRWVIMPDALARFETRHKVETPKPAPRWRRQRDVIDYYP